MLLSKNPNITIEKLATEIGVSVGTAHNVKKQWQTATQTQTSDQTNAKETGSGGFKLPQFPKGNTLSHKEAEDLAESFLQALEDDFKAIDQYLWHRQLAVGIDTNNQPVWSDMDNEEAGKIVKVMMHWGEHNATIAAIDRGIIESSDYIAVGSIMVPRVKQSVKILRETRQPREPRTRRGHENNH